MKRVLIVGAGRVGRALHHLLVESGLYAPRIADLDPTLPAALVREAGGGEAFGEPAGTATLSRALAGMSAVVSTAPHGANREIARAAAAAGTHYLDITEDVEVSRAIVELAATSSSAFIPQCGLAPGFVTLAATALMRAFAEVFSLTLRAGALPLRPTNRLKYNLTWSPEGLVNEYLNPCEVLRDGQPTWIAPLSEREEVILDGVLYEAFATSGGVGSLCRTYAGKVRDLTYKTLRYPGHLERMRFLVEDLDFRHHRAELARLLIRAVPATREDRVLVSVSATGKIENRLEERSALYRVEGRRVGAFGFTALEVATASGVAGVLHLLLENQLPQRGLVQLEDVALADFLATPFGLPYGNGGPDAWR